MGIRATPADSAPWPRVHWCPTWMLGFLPLHAAAARNPAAPGESVLDRVVSSYAVSLRTLRFAHHRPDPPGELRSLLVVSMPRTPDQPPLAGADREAKRLAGLLPGTRLLSGERARHREVSRAVHEHAWAHFACHAVQDPHSPSQGRLFLHDHRTRPFTVLDISRMRLEHAQFAYLSACETARGGLRVPNEALHLGGALQLAGYQHVIATLWRVYDEPATYVAERVYDRLHTRDGSLLAPARAAHALHDAVHAARRRHPDTPALWAGYVHFGP
jgi:CHAT domain-containing protein